MGRALSYRELCTFAAKLGLADINRIGPKSAAELAAPLQVHAPSLHRLMRTLAGLGILTERTEQPFRLDDLGAALKTGARARQDQRCCTPAARPFRAAG